VSIKDNIEAVKGKIYDAAIRSNRNPEDILLIGVSKNISPPRILEALEAGIQHFGENRVQEFLDKYEKVDKKVKWHLIGSLQTNKVKYIIDKVELIHSLDRIKLAQEIEKIAARIDKQIPVLVQVNISGETTKSGIKPDDVIDFVESVTQYPHIRVKGLMTIGPLTEDEQLIRTCFRRMKKLFDEICKRDIPHVEMQYLSMGMTNDFEIAIEEGSNMVRIGRAIFGERENILQGK